MGFREVSHTADLALEVWAIDLPGLLVEAAHGMNELMGVEIEISREIKKKISIIADDPESLLVMFLSELLYYAELERIGFYDFNITLDSYHLTAGLFGGVLKSQLKEIKAVTYHDLKIKELSCGLMVTIVFDI